MPNASTIDRFLPLTETTYYILLALTDPLHGYAVMQRVEEISSGMVKLGPGTLYGAFSQLEKAGFIVMINAEERRKQYALTGTGEQLLLAHLNRLRIMVRSGDELTQSLAANSFKETDHE